MASTPTVPGVERRAVRASSPQCDPSHQTQIDFTLQAPRVLKNRVVVFGTSCYEPIDHLLCSGMIQNAESRSTMSQVRFRTSPGRQPVSRKTVRKSLKQGSLWLIRERNSAVVMILERPEGRGFRNPRLPARPKSCHLSCWGTGQAPLSRPGLQSDLHDVKTARLSGNPCTRY